MNSIRVRGSEGLPRAAARHMVTTKLFPFLKFLFFFELRRRNSTKIPSCNEIRIVATGHNRKLRRRNFKKNARIRYDMRREY